MSSIAFEKLRVEVPELNSAWDAIESWLDSHTYARVLDPRRIGRDTGLAPVELSNALLVLVNRGALELRYAFETDAGVLLDDQLFPTPDSVPDTLRDRFDKEVDTAFGSIVPLMKAAS